MVFGVLTVLGGLAQINPVWMYGPYRADYVSTGSQPDFYVGFLEGALRLVPPWETNVAGHTLMWNVLLPAVHPRMGTSMSAASSSPLLEPPGFMLMNYGPATPVITILAHLAYGAIVGAFTAATPR